MTMTFARLVLSDGRRIELRSLDSRGRLSSHLGPREARKTVLGEKVRPG
jgi:hypothetical protein